MRSATALILFLCFVGSASYSINIFKCRSYISTFLIGKNEIKETDLEGLRLKETICLKFISLSKREIFIETEGNWQVNFYCKQEVICKFWRDQWKRISTRCDCSFKFKKKIRRKKLHMYRLKKLYLSEKSSASTHKNLDWIKLVLIVIAICCINCKLFNPQKL